MAFMIPQKVSSFKTAGEKNFYLFLQDVLKPDDQYVVWYSPTVENLEADFILFGPNVGLVTFEVKDWVIDQIIEANQQSFTLQIGEKKENRTNPLQQAKSYQYAIMNRIKNAFPQLTRDSGQFKGKSKIPIDGGVVFTNITQDEFKKAGLHKVFDLNKALFADDLTLFRASFNEPKAETFAQRLLKMFPPLFNFQLTDEEAILLNELLYPEVRVEKVQRAGQTHVIDSKDELIRLDAEQISLAKRIDHQKAIIRGVAGSGKTIVLVSKAIQELKRLREEKKDLPVLLVCFNITLVHYLRRLIAAQKAPLGSKGIHVYHFYSFCTQILGEDLAYENKDKKYYEKTTRNALRRAPHFKRKYGAVFVDEGQDFSDDMIGVLDCVKSKEALFWIACDTSQDLYQVQQEWMNDPSFYQFCLNQSYRATRQLTAFCEGLTEKEEASLVPQPKIFSVRTDEGDAPTVKQTRSIDEAASYLISRIIELHEKGVPYSEMTVLYANSRKKNLEDTVPEYLCDYIESNGILTSWVSQNAQSKMTWDVTLDCVSISTVHSMKGLDSEAVFVFGLEKLDENVLSEKGISSVAYVACTRARRYLDIIYCNTSPLIEKMKQLTF